MLNEKKIEEIRKNIQTSTLLSDHEKSDWLNLLELMNDKQLSELEEILASGGPNLDAGAASAAQPATPPVVFPPLATPKMPPLTHIANIPTDVTMSHTPVQVPESPPSVSAPLTTPPAQKPPTSTVPLAQPQSGTAEDTIPKHSSGITQPRLKIEQPEQIQEFSLETLRSNDLQSVVDAVRNQIEQHGYFKVVQFLEASPLYDSYINSGKERLRSTSGAQVSNNSLLTQEELEFMTDLLRHMRFNRW